MLYPMLYVNRVGTEDEANDGKDGVTEEFGGHDTYDANPLFYAEEDSDLATDGEANEASHRI